MGSSYAVTMQTTFDIHTEILAVRQGMWEKVAKRQHKPIQVFPFGPNADEVMLHGTVNYVMKAGGEVHDLPWAARAHLTKEDGELKMDFYQVYLVRLSPLHIRPFVPLSYCLNKCTPDDHSIGFCVPAAKVTVVLLSRSKGLEQ